MNYDSYNEELARLRIAESGAIGGLKGTVAGILLRHEVGLDMGLKEWARLRVALDGAEAAHKAVIDHMCQPMEIL